MRVGLLTAVATAIAIGAIAITGGGGGGGGGDPTVGPGTGSGLTAANIWIDQNGGTCTRSSSAIAYTGTGDSQSCSGLQSAYTACRNGDIVGIQAGTYNASSQQNIITNNTNLTSACDIRGVGVVTFSGSNGDGGGDTVQAYLANHVKISYVNITGPTRVISNISTATNDITFDHSKFTASVYPNGNITNVSFTYNEFDGLGGPSQNLQSGSLPGVPSWTTGTISHNIFHDVHCDVACSGAGQHTECVQIRAWTGTLTIDHNLFYDCNDTAQLSFGDDSFTGSPVANVYDNTFGCNTINNTTAAVTWPVDTGVTINFEYNTSKCDYMGTQGAVPPGATWNIIGNYGPYNANTCYGTNQYNLTTGGHCAGTGNQTVASIDVTNVDTTHNDFHLTGGANAIDQGGSACSSFTPDYYGATRPAGAACDAGAVEGG